MQLADKITTAQQAIAFLQHGKIGVIPTDTVYGLAARAHDQVAVARLYAAKHREHKPGTVIAASVEQLIELGVDQTALEKVSHLWPNPLSAVLPASPATAYLHQDVPGIAVRVTADPQLRQLILATGPLLTSSANLPGQPESATIQQAWDYFGDTIDFYVDGGNLAGRLASTIIKVDETGNITVVRQGALSL